MTVPENTLERGEMSKATLKERYQHNIFFLVLQVVGKFHIYQVCGTYDVKEKGFIYTPLLFPAHPRGHPCPTDVATLLRPKALPRTHHPLDRPLFILGL